VSTKTQSADLAVARSILPLTSAKLAENKNPEIDIPGFQVSEYGCVFGGALTLCNLKNMSEEYTNDL
jgi:hypothetical protein